MAWCSKYDGYNENDPTDIRDLLAYKDVRRFQGVEEKKKQHSRPHGIIPSEIYV
jgi:hypothetical protein